ncbi:hypothetical protein PG994_012741 [Apiospora phragmitis]|uniref:Uncharacterized protein n=1 Tax=Apiospora phragmitis TaxID=2905665 RepID=A0ABR1TBB2_9PEZI
MLVPQGRPGDIVNAGGGFGIPGGPSGPIFVTSVLGLSQVGESGYESRASSRKEHAPMFTTLVGTYHTDLNILQLAVQAPRTSERPTELLAGKYMFPAPAENDKNGATEGTEKAAR